MIARCGRALAYGFASLAAAAVVLPSFIAARASVKDPHISYMLHCMGCHMEDGTGAKIGRVPPIPGITGHFLKHPKGRMYLVNVPGVVNAALPDDETAAVLNYVLDVWAKPDMPPDAKPFTGEEVHELRKIKIDDITLLRKEISADLAKQGIDLHY